MDSYVEPVPGGGGLAGDARQGQPFAGGSQGCASTGGFYLGSIGGPAARLAQDCIKKVESSNIRARHGGGVAHRSRKLPAFIVIDDKGNDFFRS